MQNAQEIDVVSKDLKKKKKVPILKMIIKSCVVVGRSDFGEPGYL